MTQVILAIISKAGLRLFRTELQAKSHRQMFMKEWRDKLDAFLQFNGQEILHDGGKVTRKITDKLAIEKYENFHQNRLKQQDSQPGDIDEAIRNLE